MTTDKKRTYTSYGSVEYDTIPCAECTNDTVLSEITHVFVIDDRPDVPEVENESIVIHPVCHGCIADTYGGTAEYLDLDHETLCRFYTEQRATESGAQLTTVTPETAEASEPTAHGNVDVAVAACSRCAGEWTVDDLRSVHLPTSIVNGKLYTGTRVYCPDCRELYVTAIETEGPNFSEVVETGGGILSGAGDTGDGSLAKQLLATAIGGLIVSVILAAIHPILGGLSICVFGSIVVYLTYRHFTGLGPIE